jgi:AraC-like DNA-binding protein
MHIATRPTLAFLPMHPYARLLDFLAERGHPRAGVLASVGLGAAAFEQGDGYLSMQAMQDLVVGACALAPECALGLEVGMRMSPMSHGWLGVAALSAPTVGAAMRVMADHFDLVSPLFELGVRIADGCMAMRLTTRWALSREVECFHAAAFCASLHAQLPLLFRGALPNGIEIDVAQPRPRTLPRFVEDLQVALAFDRPHYELRAPAELASVPFPLADARVHRDALAQCRMRLDARPDPMRTASMVRRVLVASGPPFPDLVVTAKRLATSTRSLRRRLQEEGTSFRALLDEVRSSFADAWLCDPNRSITAIGLDLGYTDAANFTRAYRRTNGRSPSAARRERLGLAQSA